MTRIATRLVLVVVLGSLAGMFAYAQGTATASLSGTAVDSAGGVIPGATVAVRNKAGNTTFSTVTNDTGAFSVPSLDAGVYTVTVSLMDSKRRSSTRSRCSRVCRRR